MTHALGYYSGAIERLVKRGEARLILWPRPDPSACLAAAWFSDWVAATNPRPFVILTNPLEQEPTFTADALVSIGHKLRNPMGIAELGYEPFSEVATTDGLAIIKALVPCFHTMASRLVNRWATASSDVWDIKRVVKSYSPCPSPTFSGAKSTLLTDVHDPDQELLSIASFLLSCLRANLHDEIAELLSSTDASEAVCGWTVLSRLLSESS